MTAPKCWICRSPYRERYHLTGREGDADSPYLDPSFMKPLCHDDHQLIHDDWHTVGVPERAAPQLLNPFDRVATRLQRSAAFFGRKHEAAPGDGTWGELAESHARWGEDLREGMCYLDESYPGWREGFLQG